MATEKNFQATTPAPPSAARNSIWQVETTSSSTDAVTGQPVFKASCYQTDMVGDTGSGGADGLVPAPPAGSAAAGKFLEASGTWQVPAVAGGVSVKTTAYTAVAGDTGTLLSFNDASAVTLTLPATPPSTKWYIAVEDVGAGALTISPNGLNLDGSASSLVIQQNSGVLIYSDGTNYFTERGISPNLAPYATIVGVQESTYTGANDTGAANAYVVTQSPGTTPVKYSEFVFQAAHANTGASTLDLNGTTAPLVKNVNQPLVSGDIAVGQMVPGFYDGTNYQIGSAVATPTALVPIIRGSLLTTNSAASITIGLTGLSVPGGGTANAVAGDFALLCYGDQSGGTPGVPSGWTLVITAGTVVAQQDVWSKVLTSGDISTGSVTVTVPTGGNNTLGIVVFIGSTGGVREADLVNGLNPATVTTSGSVIAGDTAIYFGTENFGTPTPAPTVNRGTMLQSVASGSNSGALYDESLATGGAQSAIFTFSTAGPPSAATIIVKGVPTGVGSVISVGLTMPAEFAVGGSPVTSNGTLAVTKATQTANTFWRGPTSGSAAAPTFGALVPADVLGPALLTGTTASLGGSALAAGATASITVTVTGAVVGSPVAVSASDGSFRPAGIVIEAEVTSAGVVTVQLTNVTGSSITPVAKTYKVVVF